MGFGKDDRKENLIIVIIIEKANGCDEMLCVHSIKALVAEATPEYTKEDKDVTRITYKDSDGSSKVCWHHLQGFLFCLFVCFFA